MFTHGMLADSGQLIGVLLILAGAVGYLTLYYRRVVKGDHSSCGCGSGIPLRRGAAESKTSPGAADAPKQFLPVEDLSALAARHRRERDAQSPSAPAQTPPADMQPRL